VVETPLAGSSFPLADAWPDDDHLGNRLHRPRRRLASGERSGTTGELALEPTRGAHNQEPRRCSTLVGERVWRAAEREGDFARPCRPELVAELDGELAFEDVGGFVEGVRMQRRTVGVRRIVLSITAMRPSLSSLRTKMRGGEASLRARDEPISPLLPYDSHDRRGVGRRTLRPTRGG
jgi:hypothetical protein